MTNMCNSKSMRMRQRGAATLIISAILLTVGTLIIVFAANYGRMQTVSASNMNKSEQAFSAAEAGLEFGINYLKENYATVTANPVSGYFPVYTDASTTNIALSNGTQFTVAFTNPVMSNYDLIEITSVGTSADGTTTRTVSVQVMGGSILLSTPNNPLTVGGNIAMSGSSQVYNLEEDLTVEAGGTVTFQGSAQTVTAGGGSNKTHISDDVVQEGGTPPDSEVLNTYFGTDSEVLIKSNFVHVFTNTGGNVNYSSQVNGMTGTSIWIEQTSGSIATINGNTLLGTIEDPVIIVVNNGELHLAGNLNFSGFIFTMGDSSFINISGSATTSGGVVGNGSLDVSGNASISYSSSVLSNVQDLSAMSYFAKIPGTWRDY